MAKATSEIRINAPKEKVWEVLADFGGVAKWAPPVQHSVSTTEANSGVGTERSCEVPGFGTVTERATEWQEGRRIGYDVKSDGPIKSAHNSFTLSPAGNETVVTIATDIEMSGSEADRIAMEGQLSQFIEVTLAGLKHYVETGEPMPMPEAPATTK